MGEITNWEKIVTVAWVLVTIRHIIKYDVQWWDVLMGINICICSYDIIRWINKNNRNKRNRLNH